MRIACLQFAPQVGDVNNNLNRADAVLNKANPDQIDLLVLPELAFSGYNFKSLQDISPFLEPRGSGISSLWARTTALKYDCVVAVGYPEKVDVAEKWPTSPEYYNSAILVNGDGETIANYRKSFLYYTDETWALEGDGFFEGHIPGLGHTAMGICMDINPYRFETAWHAFEFAFHILEIDANLVILSMAWLTREDQRTSSRMPKEPDMETLTYWIARLEPVIRSENEDEIIVVFCNRTGTEDEAVYAGTSTVIGIKQEQVKVYGILGRGDKELLVVDTESEPFAQLVYRPDNEGEGQTPVLHHRTASQHSSGSSGKDSTKKESTNGAATPTQRALTPTQRTATLNQWAPTLNQRAPTPNRRSPTPSQRTTTPKQRIPTPSPPLPNSRSGRQQTSTRQSARLSSTKPVRPHSPAPTPRGSTPRQALPPESGPPPQGAPPAPVQRRGTPREQLPPLVPVPQVPRSSTIKSPRKDRPSPKIQIPQTESRPKGGIPTPTGPSPTPIELRPKLAVPDMTRRKRTNDTHTDTPHPFAGPARDPWQVYGGGRVGVKPHDPFTPITPFQDTSPPTSPRYFWVPSDTLLKTPALPTLPDSFKSHGKDLPTPMTAVPSGSNMDTPRAPPAPKRTVHKLRDSFRPSQQKREPSQHKQEPSHHRREPSKGRKKEMDSILDAPNDSLSEVPLPARPASPKSRTASRQRGAERPDSVADQRAELASVNQRLEAVTRRPGSALDQRQANSNQEVMPARPSSPKSRNASRSRGEDPVIDQRLKSLSRSSIVISASPSIYDQGGGRPRSASFRHTTPSRSKSRNSGLPQRPESALAMYQRTTTRNAYRTGTPLMPVNFVENPNDGTVSRGRMREPRGRTGERSHSANSTWPEPPKSRFPSPGGNEVDSGDEIVYIEGEGPVYYDCPVHGAHHKASECPTDDFVAIEGTLSENCPVHGSNSRPPHERRRTDSTQRRSESTRQGTDGDMRSRRDSAQRNSTDCRRTSTQKYPQSTQTSQQQSLPLYSSPQPSPPQQYPSPPPPPQQYPPQQSPPQHSPPEPLYPPSGHASYPFPQHLPTSSKSSPMNPCFRDRLITPEPATPKAMVLFSETELKPLTPCSPGSA